MEEQSTNTEAATLKPGQTLVDGKVYMRDGRGALVPIEAIKARDILIDETTRKILAHAQELSAQVARFKTHTFDDVDGLQALLEQDYGAKAGGAKGNITLTTFDGLQKVQVQVQDSFAYGPELQVAKKLVDECLTEWTAGSNADLRAVVHDAFRVDQEGQVSRSALLGLLRLEIEDARWNRAMTAIRDAERVISSKSYVRFYRRATPKAAWEGVPIDVAAL